MESTQHSSWCCFFTENPIGVKLGSNVLIQKPEVQTGCLFGFNPETNCAQCLFGFDPQTDLIHKVHVSGHPPITMISVYCTAGYSVSISHCRIQNHLISQDSSTGLSLESSTATLSLGFHWTLSYAFYTRYTIFYISLAIMDTHPLATLPLI